MFKCKSSDGKIVFALKEIDVAKNGIADLKNEIEILGGLQHENVVTFIDFFPNVEQFCDVEKVFLLTEFVPGNIFLLINRS